MGIQMINERSRVPILGKIRLGIRKESQRGSLFPSEVEYFVLKDAPEVAKIYGPEPKELDVMFTSNSLDDAIPTWLRWYSGGGLNKDGEFAGGTCQCIGNGPDALGNPGQADFRAKRDPISLIVPKRDCLGPQCVDWFGPDGKQQCRQAMNVMVKLPRVSVEGVYQIDTGNWRSIQSFNDVLAYELACKRPFEGKPFKIVRKPTDHKYFDKKDGKDKVGKHYSMFLVSNPEFLELHGEQCRLIDERAKTTLYQPTCGKQIALQPMAPPVDTEEEPELQAAPDPIDAFLAAEGVVALIDKLGTRKGRAYSDKEKRANTKTWQHKNPDGTVEMFKAWLQSQVDAIPPKPPALDNEGII